MSKDQSGLIDADLTEKVIGVFYSVYNELGLGFVESVYENAMALALRGEGLQVEQQAPLTVLFRGRVVGEFRDDMVIERRILVALKVASRIIGAQLLNTLKATGLTVGLLLNFGPKARVKCRVFTSSKIRSCPTQSAPIRVKN